MDHIEHLNRALGMIQDSVSRPPVPQAASLSLCSEQIAQALSDAQHLQVGADPRPLKELILGQRERFRSLAEQAIESLDPNMYQAAVESSVAQILTQYKIRVAVNIEELARETLSVFLSEISKTREPR